MASITETFTKTQYIDGKKRTIESDRYGKTFYMDDNGKRVYINLEELKSVSIMDKKWAGVQESCEKQKKFHANWRDKWLALAGSATEKYKAGLETLKSTTNEYTQFLNKQNCKYSELRGAEKKEADGYLSSMSDARSQKNRGCSDSIFYNRLAADESFSIQDWNNLQAIATKMSQA